MTVSGIAHRYALALVDAVTEPGAGMDTALALTQLQDFESTTRDARDLYLALVSPAVPPQRKREVIIAVADASGIAYLIRNFLLVLSDHRRMNLLPEVLRAFAVLLDERLGFIRADISSAALLTPEEERDIAERLGAVTGCKVRMNVVLDPDLIGGVVARVGSSVYDGSVRGQLRAIGERLAAE